jgi:hypothetical protein
MRRFTALFVGPMPLVSFGYSQNAMWHSSERPFTKEMK